LQAENHTLKRSLTDPHIFSGIGNAYSDEILHRAELSPIAMSQKLTSPRSTASSRHPRYPHRMDRPSARRGAGAFPERSPPFARRWRSTPLRRTMPTMWREGPAHPLCEQRTNYCARCQTGGRLLADRALPASSTRIGAHARPNSTPANAAHRIAIAMRFQLAADFVVGFTLPTSPSSCSLHRDSRRRRRALAWVADLTSAHAPRDDPAGLLEAPSAPHAPSRCSKPLRLKAGATGYLRDFIGYWLDRLIFYTLRRGSSLSSISPSARCDADLLARPHPLPPLRLTLGFAIPSHTLQLWTRLHRSRGHAALTALNLVKSETF